MDTSEVTVYFGQFGERTYSHYVQHEDAIRIPCRWCIGDDRPTLNCAACKNTRLMWVSL